jgi:hypothetical protein
VVRDRAVLALSGVVTLSVRPLPYVTHLLRRSWREGGKVRHETLGNISHLPEEVVELRTRRKRERKRVVVNSEHVLEGLTKASSKNAAAASQLP